MIVSPETTAYYQKQSGLPLTHLWKLAIEIFQTIKSSNPYFMDAYFKKYSHSARIKNDLVINRAKTGTFNETSLTTLGPKILNSLPEDVKDLTFLQKITELIKTWYESECKCKYSDDPYHYT